VGLSKKTIGGADEGKVRQVAMKGIEFVKGLMGVIDKREFFNLGLMMMMIVI